MVPAAEMARDERRPGFNQPASQQRALPPRVPAIPLPYRGVFLRQIERFPRIVAGNQIKRLPFEPVNGIEFTAAVRLAAKVVEMADQSASVVQSIQRELLRQAQVLHLE